MKLIDKVELIPGYKTKLNAVTALDTNIPEHQYFLNAVKQAVMETPEMKEALDGKQYYVRIKPVELEILIK